jgi:toxin ParE1/3/4
MSFSFSPKALRNIDEIHTYVARENPAAARKILDRIHTIAAYLGDFPLSGRPTGLREIRVCPVHPYPYLIFFRPVPGKKEVRILRVRHAARRPLFLNDPAALFAHDAAP